MYMRGGVFLLSVDGDIATRYKLPTREFFYIKMEISYEPSQQILFKTSGIPDRNRW